MKDRLPMQRIGHESPQCKISFNCHCNLTLKFRNDSATFGVVLLHSCGPHEQEEDNESKFHGIVSKYSDIVLLNLLCRHQMKFFEDRLVNYSSPILLSIPFRNKPNETISKKTSRVAWTSNVHEYEASQFE